MCSASDEGMSTEELQSLLAAKQQEWQKLTAAAGEREAADASAEKAAAASAAAASTAAAPPAAAAPRKKAWLDQAAIPSIKALVMPCCMVMMLGKSAKMTDVQISLTTTVMLFFMYWGQKLINRMENSEWRKKLKEDAEANVAKSWKQPGEKEKKSKGDGSGSAKKRNKKAD